MYVSFTKQAPSGTVYNWESIRIYMRTFKISLIEAIHIDASDPSLELTKNELGLRFLYKVKSNSAYTKTLAFLGEGEDHKYDDSEKATMPLRVNLRRLGRRLMEEPRILEKNTCVKPTPP